MTNDPAFLFYPKDWLTSHKVLMMTPEQRGAYINLLAHAWIAPDCGLPDDDRQLGILSGLHDRWPEHASEAVRRCFRVNEGWLFNDRLLVERKRREEWKTKSSLGGVKSGKARKKKKMRLLKGGSTKGQATHEDANANEDAVASGTSGSKRNRKEQTWRTSFEVYQAEELTGLKTLLADDKWMAQQQRWNQNLDILLTLEKAHCEFWGTEAGWAWKKKHGGKAINWKRTYGSAITMPQNRVWKKKTSQQYGHQTPSNNTVKESVSGPRPRSGE